MSDPEFDAYLEGIIVGVKAATPTPPTDEVIAGWLESMSRGIVPDGMNAVDLCLALIAARSEAAHWEVEARRIEREWWEQEGPGGEFLSEFDRPADYDPWDRYMPRPEEES